VGPAAKWQPHHQNRRRMVKNERYQEFDGRRFPVLRFDGQNQTRAKVGWSNRFVPFIKVATNGFVT
jgi:hypothetical protein